VTRNTISTVENNESIAKGTRSGLEASSCVSVASEFAEAFDGGFEYLPLWRLRLWPFTLIRLFEQEE
jgi:hypothetical protein